MVSRSLLVKASMPHDLEVNELIEDYMHKLYPDELWKRKDKAFGKRLSILKGGPIPSITWTQQ
ncbi:MAG: hypothetical protein QW837_01545 [Conexivisphaerales archaeon]